METLNELIGRYPGLSGCAEQIAQAADTIIACYRAGGRFYLCGNGGSAADADHIVGELMKGFLKKRPLSDTQKQAMTERCPELDMRVLDKLQQGLPALSLCSLTALNTAFCNTTHKSDYS
jgi:D-sedoheptulose 7-phosphate isomerase